MRRTIEVAAIGLLFGCSFDSGSLGDGGSTSSESTGGSDVSSAGESSGAAAGSSSGSSDSTAGDVAEPLVRVEPPMLDFGGKALGDTGLATVTLFNDGDAAAEGLQVMVEGEGFSFNGGSYPGGSGDCGDRLEPAASCTLELAFAPAELGPYGGTLRIGTSLDADAIAADLDGSGAGSTANLIANPDAEMSGTPPPGWTVIDGGWTTTDTFVYAGSSSFTAGLSGDGAIEVTMEQSVDLSALGRSIDADSSISFAVAAQARSANLDNNEFRVVLVWRDDRAAELGRYESDWATTADWVAVARSEVPPVGTRSALVQLRCRKPEGVSCDAYFDDVSLVGTAPVPQR